MTARDDLLERLKDDWYIPRRSYDDEAEQLINAFAHELAEKIRAESCGYGCEYTFANLIDPEVDK